MPAPIAPFVAFTLGVLLGWAAARQAGTMPLISLANPSFVIVLLYTFLVFTPALGYFVAFVPDWSFAYLVDPSHIPSAVTLVFCTFCALCVIFGFVLGAPRARPRQPLAVLPHALVPLAVSAIIVAVLSNRLSTYGSYQQYRRHLETVPLGGSPAGYAVLWLDTCLILGTLLTARELRRLR